jgi:phenylacetate-CoA ligase
MGLLKELEETQWWPRDRIRALQDERLRRLVRYANENVPFYRSLFERHGLQPEDIQSTEDLVKLPVLTRRLVRENLHQIRDTRFSRRQLRALCTGGSTGEPLEFYRAKDDIACRDAAAGLRAFGWAGYELGMKCAWFTESPLYEASLRRLARVAKAFSQRVTVFDACQLSVDNLPHLAKRLEGFDGGFIRGYPTAIYLLARFIESEGKSRIRPKAIITSGEALHGSQKALLSRVFECDVFSCYRSNELNMIAGQCPVLSGYHISAENVIVEIVDDEGTPVRPGQEGRILVTNLHSHAMPFIRYEMGDVGVGTDAGCPCGRGLPLLTAVSGRVTDVVRTPSGTTIPGVALPLNSLASLGVDQFQVVQDTLDRVTVKIVLSGGVSPDRAEAAVSEIGRQYRDALGGGMEVVVEPVEEIELTPSGKRRVVISHLLDQY